MESEREEKRKEGVSGKSRVKWLGEWILNPKRCTL